MLTPAATTASSQSLHFALDSEPALRPRTRLGRTVIIPVCALHAPGQAFSRQIKPRRSPRAQQLSRLRTRLSKVKAAQRPWGDSPRFGSPPLEEPSGGTGRWPGTCAHAHAHGVVVFRSEGPGVAPAKPALRQRSRTRDRASGATPQTTPAGPTETGPAALRQSTPQGLERKNEGAAQSKSGPEATTGQERV